MRQVECGSISRTLRFLARHLRSRRVEIGTRWRRLAAGRQALLALAHLRCGDTCAQLATGFRIGIATVYRYIREAVDILANLAPWLTEAMRSAPTKAFVLLLGQAQTATA
ncbi:transposase [Streptomyces viridochromogenes]|uniref:Transposase n=1 Tax=Streptomyces viridochromogenes TaxID=1938 RepID=A0A0L8K1D1_STRVR|nr:transposase [Streptomyces viridochromogenes]